jgi:hypothetical protein
MWLRWVGGEGGRGERDGRSIMAGFRLTRSLKLTSDGASPRGPPKTPFVADCGLCVGLWVVGGLVT